jgi:hypothetical protein
LIWEGVECQYQLLSRIDQYDTHCIIFASMVVSNSNVAEVATSYCRIVVAGLNRRVVDRLSCHVSIDKSLDCRIAAWETVRNIIDIADVGQAGSNGSRSSSRDEK